MPERMLPETIGTPGLWIGFTVFVLAMLALDLGVFHRKAHAVTLKEAASWSAVWVGLAVVFNVGVWNWFGSQKALEFTTGYLLEKSLAVDNIFVFLVVFSAFAVPAAYQHRVLFWGILGALVMRAAFIFAGAALLARFHWVMYVFGAILLLTAVKLLRSHGEESDPTESWVTRTYRRFVPSTDGYRGDRFFVKEAGKWLATPLFLVLIIIEVTDLVFAVDSIPAIFAVTSDPFIVFTSNIFAILGLRSMYFLLAGVMEKFHLLKIGLAVVLAFVGVKMLLIDVYKIPILASLAVIVAVIGGSIGLSFLFPQRAKEALPHAEPDAPAPRASGA
jgi:tellurite resistance protein TerC